MEKRSRESTSSGSSRAEKEKEKDKKSHAEAFALPRPFLIAYTDINHIMYMPMKGRLLVECVCE